jgi:hypothetical protein
MGEPAPRCHGCGSTVGEQHNRISDMARCRATGLQRDECDHTKHRAGGARAGRVDGTVARRGGPLMLRVVCVAGTRQGWIACSLDDPDAQPDLNRRYTGASCDAVAARWGA